MIKSQKLRPTPFFQRFTTVCDMFIIFYKDTKKTFFWSAKSQHLLCISKVFYAELGTLFTHKNEAY